MVIKSYNKINKSIFLGNPENFVPVVYILNKLTIRDHESLLQAAIPPVKIWKSTCNWLLP